MENALLSDREPSVSSRAHEEDQKLNAKFKVFIFNSLEATDL